MARPGEKEIKKKMLELVRANGPYKIMDLWMATRLAFGQKFEDLYTDRWIRDIDLRRSIASLVDEHDLFFLANRTLSSQEEN